MVIFDDEFKLSVQKVSDSTPGFKIFGYQFYIGAYHFGKLINILYLLE